MRLRQVALAAGSLEPGRRVLMDLLGVTADYADPGVGEFGLENSVMALGDTFIEIVAPRQPGTAVDRWLTRHQGDGGYMLLFQVADAGEWGEYVDSLGVRKVWETDRAEVTAFHLHPADTGGAILSLDEMRPPAAWLWAGPGWPSRAATHVNGIESVTVQSKDEAKLAERWSTLLRKPLHVESGHPVIDLDQGRIRFVPDGDGRGEMVSEIKFACADRQAVEAAAASHGLQWAGRALSIGGVRCHFE